MINKLSIFILFTLIFISTKLHALDNNVEGSYSVGKTSCTIEWDNSDRAYKVYWNEGIGYTLLFYKEDLPNGNIVYEEYESSGNTYTGKFTFKDYRYSRGEYERSDGKVFNVKKR
jgi:hypothetical protein